MFSTSGGAFVLFASQANPRERRNRSTRAFSLIELIVVLMVLGVLAGVAAPRLFSLTTDAEAAAIVSDVNRILDAALRYEALNGRLPDNAPGGVFPTDLEGYLPKTLFTERTLFGSPLGWDGPGTGSPAYGVSIYLTAGVSYAQKEVYESIEAIADDGDEANGWVTRSKSTIYFHLTSK